MAKAETSSESGLSLSSNEDGKPVQKLATKSIKEEDTPKWRRLSKEEEAQRTKELKLEGPRPRRESLTRRGGVVTSTESIFEGLKEKFNSMEKLETEGGIDSTKSIRTADVEFIRILAPAQFRIFLQKHGVPVDQYGKDAIQSKTVRDLWAEVVFRECALEPVRNPLVKGGLGLQRAVRVIFVEVEALIGSEARYLLLQDETKTTSARRNLNTRPSKKMFDDEDVEEATWRCMVQNFTISEKLCCQLFKISAKETRQEVKPSSGFPGLATAYNMEIVSLQTIDTSRPELQKLGLPDGSEFSTQTKQVLGSSTRYWKWCSLEELKAAKAATAGILTSRAAGARSHSICDLSQGIGAGN